MLLSIVILDTDTRTGTEQPVTLRQLQERYLLRPEFYGQLTLNEKNLVDFIKQHPQYTLRLTAIGAPV